MDGRGRCLDNVFIERLWRSLKYETVYLHELADGFAAEQVISEWMTFYSDVRPHSALGGRTPAETYRRSGRREHAGSGAWDHHGGHRGHDRRRDDGGSRRRAWEARDDAGRDLPIGYTLTKSATFPENRTTSVSRSLTDSSTVPFHRGGRCFVRLPVSRSLTGSSTLPVHQEGGGSRQPMSGPSTISHPALWTCPACGRPLTVALNPEGGEAGAHRPLEISRASAAAHACAPAARFPQFHSASSSSSITGYEPASCQPWQSPVSAADLHISPAKFN